jgi:hypothetical protein
MSSPHRDEMLELSVHSLPHPGDTVGPSLVGSRLKLLAIVFACSLPVLLAYLAYYVVRPQGEAAFGELISPVRTVPVAMATNLDGTQVPLPSLKAQWLLVKVDGGECAQDCQKQLLMLRQFRLMLGKDMDRVDWVWLISDQVPVNPVLSQGLKKDQATVLRVDPQVLQAWFAAPQGKLLKDFIFVVDPMGNTMMRLPARFDSAGAAKARRDMEHLLRASLPWDPPGR